MIRELLIRRQEKREIFLEWGMRFEKDVFWTDKFEELSGLYPNFKFDLVLSKPEEYWQKCKGHVNDCIEKHLPDLGGWEAYLCGSKAMVEGMKETLKAKNMSDDNIHFEKFY
jgi:NAD(P)H-flavin reductase